MPKIGGVGLASRFGKMPPHARVLFTSGHVEEFLISRGIPGISSKFIQNYSRRRPSHILYAKRSSLDLLQYLMWCYSMSLRMFQLESPREKDNSPNHNHFHVDRLWTGLLLLFLEARG
jgi:hypothetical protein